MKGLMQVISITAGQLFWREMDFGFIVDIGGSCMECIRRYTRPTLMKMP